MKKLLFLLIFTFTFSLTFAQEEGEDIEYPEGYFRFPSEYYDVLIYETKYYNNISQFAYEPNNFSIYFNLKDEEFFIVIKHFFPEHDLRKTVISLAQFRTLRLVAEKFQEWEKIALEHQVTIEKELPDLHLYFPEFTWPSVLGAYDNIPADTDDTYTLLVDENGAEYEEFIGLNISFSFVSREADTHFLSIYSNRLVADDDSGEIYFLDELFLSSEQVAELLESLQPEELDRKMEEFVPAFGKVGEYRIDDLFY